MSNTINVRIIDEFTGRTITRPDGVFGETLVEAKFSVDKALNGIYANCDVMEAVVIDE